jgi:putative transposase
MILGRKATFRPSAEQARAFGRACGAARKAWNWGLTCKQDAWLLRKAALESGVAPKDAPKVPNAIALHRELNLLKKLSLEEGGFPWMYESSKCAPQEALRSLDAAFENFFRRVNTGEPPGYPRFKSRRSEPGHFTVTGSIHVKAGRIRLPRVGSVRFMPGDRGYLPEGVYTSATIREEGGRWCVSVHLEIAEAAADDTRPVVGLDAGVRELAHLSDGTVIENPRALAREAKRLRRTQLSIARKQRAADKRLGKRKKGERREESKRLKRARRRLARLNRRVANVREDALHKATTWLARTYSVVVVEKLDGAQMTERRKGRGRARKARLNGAILDSGMLRLRSLLAYKMPLHGGALREVGAAYTSQMCSRCGARNAIGASKRYECAKCRIVLDRDENASQNIKSAASCSAEPVRESVSARRGAAVRPKAKAPRRAALSRPSEGEHL